MSRPLSPVHLSPVPLHITENLLVSPPQMDGFKRHFDSQFLIYGKQTILNLARPVSPFLPVLFDSN